MNQKEFLELCNYIHNLAVDTLGFELRDEEMEKILEQLKDEDGNKVDELFIRNLIKNSQGYGRNY